MLAVFENAVDSVEMFLISIPESLGVLVFGIVLVAAAVIIRRWMSRQTEAEKKADPTGKALANR
ncbi:MAG: hypothetical protein IPM59_07425 [Chloracidobacterium sp.]|nr:hypothetical protein [Chloracidobacterium sp.]